MTTLITIYNNKAIHWIAMLQFIVMIKAFFSFIMILNDE